LGRLRPEIEVARNRYRLIADRMSVLTRKDIGAVVVSSQDREWDTRRSLDLAFVGM
jgi:hypothetical protein